MGSCFAPLAEARFQCPLERVQMSEALATADRARALANPQASRAPHRTSRRPRIARAPCGKQRLRMLVKSPRHGLESRSPKRRRPLARSRRSATRSPRPARRPAIFLQARRRSRSPLPVDSAARRGRLDRRRFRGAGGGSGALRPGDHARARLFRGGPLERQFELAWRRPRRGGAGLRPRLAPSPRAPAAAS